MKKLLFILLLTLWGAQSYGQAANVFVTQAGAGAANGTSLGNAFPITALSSGANCGAGATQIGANTVVHISVNSSGSSGTANFPANGAMFSFPCSGTSGNPITLQFKSGDVWQSPVFTDNPGAIQLSNRAFIILDLNGATIQDTLNGHTGGGVPNVPAAPCPAGPCTFNQKSVLVQALQCNTCEIKGGTLANTYVEQQCENPGNPGDGHCGASGDANQNAIQFSGSTFKVHDMTMHDNTWTMLETQQATGDSLELYNSNIYNMDHGLACGAAPNTTITFLKIHDNHFHDMANFDTGGSDDDHHDGIHCFSSLTNSAITNLYVYNNLFDGNAGACCFTAWIFLEGFNVGTPWTNNTGTAHIWNNVFIGTIDSGNGQISINAGTNHEVYNNTIIQTGAQQSGGKCFNARGGGGTETINFRNNIMQGCAQAYSLDNNVAIGTWNNNVYSNFTGQGNEQFNWSGHSSGNTNTLAQWRAICGCDAQAVGGTGNISLGLDSSGKPQNGSIVINAGANLSAQGVGLLSTLLSDTTAGNSRTPTVRPSSPTAWTSGAFNPGSATVTIAPTSHDYGTIVQHVTSAPFTYTVTNVSGATLNLSTPCCSISGTNALDFVISSKTCTDNLPLAPAATCTVSVTFTPNTTALENAVLQVGGASGGTSQLQGTGQAPATAAIQLTPNPVNFPNTNVGSGSADITVTFKNTGTANFQFVNTTSFITVSNAVFVRDSTTCTQNGILAPNAICTAGFSFHPVAAGAVSATVTANGNATGTTTLNGTGVSAGSPLITVTPTSFDFGNQLKGTTSALHNFTITNTGSANATMGSSPHFYSFTGGSNPADFARVSPGGSDCTDGQILAPAAFCLISVAFTPSVSGFESGGLNILSNAATASSSLTGTGIFPKVTIIPSPIQFGSINQGTPSSPQVVTIQNSGTATLTGLSLSVTGTSAAYYTIPSNTCAATLAAAASCTANVVFTPGAAGTFTDTFNVNGNATGTAQLTGTGVSVAPIITISPRPVNFPNSVTGIPTSGVVVTISNTGSAIQSSLGYTITTGDFIDWARSSTTCGATLAAGASCTMTFIFTPSGAPRAETTLMTITGTATSNAAFNGTGTASGTTPAPAPLFVQIDLFPPKITITGTNFVNSTAITIDGAPQATVCSATVCTANLSQSVLLLPGFGVIGHTIGVK